MNCMRMALTSKSTIIISHWLYLPFDIIINISGDEAISVDD